MTIRVWLTNPIGWELPATTGRGLDARYRTVEDN
jgi:hypothetical protein